MRYQIEAGNELDLFSLNPTSGVLSLKQSLMDGFGAKVSFHSLRITATDGENFATPLYINITVAALRKPVNLQCEETGVAKMLAEKLLQANKLHSQERPRMFSLIRTLSMLMHHSFEVLFQLVLR